MICEIKVYVKGGSEMLYVDGCTGKESIEELAKIVKKEFPENLGFNVHGWMQSIMSEPEDE